MTIIRTVTKKTVAASAMSLLALNAYASVEPQQCENVRFADVGWTDITATTAITTELLKGLGYQTKTDLLSEIGRASCRERVYAPV